MSGAFKKLLLKELGHRKYEDYFAEYKRLDEIRKEKGDHINCLAVFDDIYEGLKENGKDTLQQKYNRLRSTMARVFRICKHYMFVLLTYVAAALIIIWAGENPQLNLLCVVVLSILFCYKTHEFAVNKYSYLDAYILIAYKAALERRLLEQEENCEIFQKEQV